MRKASALSVLSVSKFYLEVSEGSSLGWHIKKRKDFWCEWQWKGLLVQKKKHFRITLTTIIHPSTIVCDHEEPARLKIRKINKYKHCSVDQSSTRLPLPSVRPSSVVVCFLGLHHFLIFLAVCQQIFFSFSWRFWLPASTPIQLLCLIDWSILVGNKLLTQHDFLLRTVRAWIVQGGLGLWTAIYAFHFTFGCT